MSGGQAAFGCAAKPHQHDGSDQKSAQEMKTIAISHDPGFAT
jgi:hypothetical protein